MTVSDMACSKYNSFSNDHAQNNNAIIWFIEQALPAPKYWIF
jgi:hypothetical protein